MQHIFRSAVTLVFFSCLFLLTVAAGPRSLLKKGDRHLAATQNAEEQQAGSEPVPTFQPAAKPALKRATPWTTSRVQGSPEPPPPYRIEPAFPKLKFTRPVIITNAPGTDRLFVAELDGKIYSFPNDAACEKTDLFFDLPKHVEGGRVIYGLTFQPDFEANRFAYLCYVLRDGDPDGTRVSRFEVTRTDPPQIKPETELQLISWLSGGHNGGCLKFGHDGYLYIATGDATAPSPPDGLHTGQDCSDLLSSILRIDVEHASPEQPYRVPPDNPFVETEGVRPEIWSFGFRNPWKMSFDRKTGDLWTGDVGWELWEMVYHVVRGGNYGWSVMEGPQPVRPEGERGPTPILPPVASHPHSEAASVTGGYVYYGKRLSDLVGAYIYGDYVSGKIWALRYDGKKVTWHKELTQTPLQIICFAEDHAGELYVMDYERTGQIYSLVSNEPAGVNSAFPRTLSQTGLFASPRDHTPAAGVLPYTINASQWADHATAERLLALPGASQIEFHPQQQWQFPEGTVLAKTLALQLQQGDPATSRRIETQLMHFEDGRWRFYSYAWNDEQTDATLVDAAGMTRNVAVADPAAAQGKREHAWRFAARSECGLCHNPQAGHVLAAGTAQLLGSGQPGRLRHLAQVGAFSNPLPETLHALAHLADPYDTSADINARARSYFHVNCSHCHRNGGGGTATIELMANLALDRTRTVDVRPAQGTFGIAGAKIVAPGDPYASVLFYRVAKLGRGRMPRAGSEFVDERALELIHDWIAQLPAGNKTTKDTKGTSGTGVPPVLASASAAKKALQAARTPAARIGTVEQLTSSTRGALLLAHLMTNGNLDKDARATIVEHTGASSAVEVRDLFERFLPPSQRTRRLGTAVKPAEILALPGNATRGRDLFFNDSAAQCKTCHRIAQAGGTVGPELTEIGKKYPRAELLTQILEPSNKIEPRFVTYAIETKAGQVHTGILVENTPESVTLRNAQDKLVRVPAAEIALLAPQERSLMPELLLRDLTAQQVADLLAYLTSLN